MTEERQLSLKHKTILRTALDGFWEMNTEGGFLDVNEAYCRMSGYTRDELLTMGVDDVEANEGKQDVRDHIKEVKRTGSDFSETRHRRKDGSVFPVEVCTRFVPDWGGRLFVFVRDVTNRERTESALRESEQQFRLLAESIDEVFWMSDPVSGKATYVSPAYERVWGRPRNSLFEAFGGFLSTVHPEDRDRVARFLELDEHGAPFSHEYRILRPDGSVAWILDRGFPVRGANGDIKAYAGIAQDITERKEADAAIREREAILHGFFESPGAARGVVEMVHGEVIHLSDNAEAAALFGLTQETMRGKLDAELGIPEDVRQRWIHPIREEQNNRPAGAV